MKILMTTDTIGGVWTYAVELARALEPYNIEVALATLGTLPTTDQRAEVDRLPNVRLFESTYRLEWMDQPWDDVASAGQWLQLVAQLVGADVIHLNHFSPGVEPWDVPVLMVGHSCVTSWFHAVRGIPPDLAWRHYQQMVSAGLRAADLVVAPTRTMLRWLDEHYGPLLRQRVIANGLDPARFRTTKKSTCILSAGRMWDEAKNLQLLTRVAPQLTWPLVVAGIPHPDGHQPATPGVTFLGRLTHEQMVRSYARAAIYALPARYEPLVLTPLEDAPSGCALVLGDIPTLREIWQDAAQFVAPDDEAHWVAALRMFIGDPVLRQEFAERARRRAWEMTSARMARDYAAVYAELLEARAAGIWRHTRHSPTPFSPATHALGQSLVFRSN